MTRPGVRGPVLALLAALTARAQTPMLQDAAATLRQAELAWTLGDPPPLPPFLPSFEVGLGGAGSEGSYAPQSAGEGLSHGTQGWGVAIQGRYGREGWSVSATILGLRDGDRTLGLLQRFTLAYETESGWRAALEQGPMAWGSGLLGGDLAGSAARSFPRLSLVTPEVGTPLGRWQMEAFAGRLGWNRPIPAWMPDGEARAAARADGMDLRRPDLMGGLIRVSFGALVEARLGAVTLSGGRDARGLAAPAAAARTMTLAELKARLPLLAQALLARGASLRLSRQGLPERASPSLDPGRNLVGLRVAWESWDLGLEYAGRAPETPATFPVPAYLAGFSSHGEALGAPLGPWTVTRTVAFGLPLPLEGRGRFHIVRASLPDPSPEGGAWLLQAEAQWPTATGRLGASLASWRADTAAPASARWGWSFSLSQAFRVF